MRSGWYRRWVTRIAPIHRSSRPNGSQVSTDEGNDDVLQAGTNITACGTSYAAWYEWYTGGCTRFSATLPRYETDFSLAVNPGDPIDAEVWYTTTADYGHVYILNVTIGVAVSVSFNHTVRFRRFRI